MIEFQDVSVSFGAEHNRILDRLSLTVPESETLVLLGASGCGKTTILKLILRLIEPSAGRITVDGKPVEEYSPIELRRKIGYVFQGAGLFPHMSVTDNIAIVLKLMGIPPGERRRRSFQLMESIGLDPVQFAGRYPDELSGGQKQRVGVARALAADPSYLLMDEPFGALDNIKRRQMQDELMELRKRIKKTIIFVTHDILEALRLGDTIAVMQAGQIVQAGSGRELLESPQTPFVRDLFTSPLRELDEYRQWMA